MITICIINKVSLLHLVIVSKISFKAKCYLLYSMLLDILVGCSDVAMSSLVTCNYHSSDGNKLLLGCHDCLPRTKYKESSNSKNNLSWITLGRLVVRIATHFVWTFGLATRNTSQFPTLYIKLLQVPRNKRGS